MALNEFPKALYKRLLKAAKKIDTTHSEVALHSILRGTPSIIYSYASQSNVDIGSTSHSIYDRLISILNNGEYSYPIRLHPFSLYSIIRSTARLCATDSDAAAAESKKVKNNKFRAFSNYCKEIPITFHEILEMVQYFESLSDIANKIAHSRQQRSSNIQWQTEAAAATDTLLQSQVIHEINDDDANYCSDRELQLYVIHSSQNQAINTKETALVCGSDVVDQEDENHKLHKNKPKTQAEEVIMSIPVLEYVPKYVDHTAYVFWRNSIMFQHPLSTMSAYTNHNRHMLDHYVGGAERIEPYILLGVYPGPQQLKPRLGKKSKTKSSTPRVSLILNGEKTLLHVEDVLQHDEYADAAGVYTSHGFQSVPAVFNAHSLYIGGDALDTVEVLTTNPYCKGTNLCGSKLYWNPNLAVAAQVIEKGFGSADEFRFLKGSMRWDQHLWQNVQQRNLYGLLMTGQNNNASWTALSKLIWGYHDKQERNEQDMSLWFELLDICFTTDSKDVESWLKLYELINDQTEGIRHDVHRLMQMHDIKISKQIQMWAQQQSMQS